ncbi:MAG: gephyrin-like molybdotransferase Glp [Pseudomonadota bacterium]
MAQLTDDCFAHGRELMTMAEALALIEELATPLSEPEDVALADATGRILADNVTSTMDVPPHDNSAVDGYAVFHDDLNPDGETILPIGGRAAAGHPLDRPAQRGEAIRIFTGAPMPDGPDTVMMQEDTREDGDRVVLMPGIKPGANRRHAGEDVTAGSRILAKGERLRPQDVGLAASVGVAHLCCYRPLDVAVFSTGDEVTEPGMPLAKGAIYDANRYAVAGLLRGLGCRVTDLGILADRGPETESALAEAAASHDVLLTSGGVSVGEEDHIRATIENLGTLYAWHMAIKPGRPLMLGQLNQTPFVGLPGNPAAAIVTFLRFGRPLILRLAGATAVDPLLFEVRAAFGRKKKANRREFVRVRLTRADDGQLEAHAFPREGAGIMSSLVETDGLAELPEDMTRLEPGTMIDVLPFSEVIG